jgi:nucleoid DNA-binding protein
VREIRPRSPLRDAAEMVRIIAEGTVRTATLPLGIGALIAGGILRGGRQADERRLLKNAEDEYTIAARALATCRAGQSIAEQVHDGAAADLLASLRRQDEELLEALEDTVAEHARAVATTNGGRPAPANGGLTGVATRAVRTTADRLREAAQTGGQQTRRTAADAVREMPGVTRMAEEVQSAVTREEELPIPGYGRLTVTDITQRLRMLPQVDLIVVERYERVHANRPGVLNTIERLRGNQPWPGYDTTNPDQISTRLRTADPALARQVLDYEQRHQQRRTVITAAEQRAT